MKIERYFKILGFLVFYMTLSPLSCYTSSFLEVLAYMAFICGLLVFGKKYDLFANEVQKDRSRTIFIFSIAFLIPAVLHFQTPFVTDVLQWVSLLLVISLRNDCRSKVLSSAISIYSAVLLCSIVEYVIGYTTGFSYSLTNSATAGSIYSQSIFNIYRYGDLTYRFTALTNEPGALGATCGFILAFLPANKKNLFPLVVCLVGGILSLSLAFYVYWAFILIYKTIAREINFKYIIVIAMVLVLSSLYFYEKIQTAIVMRITETEHLDNRSSEQVNYFVSHIFDSGDAIYGVGNKTAYALQENSGEGNAGLKWKLFQYGIVGCGSYLLAMFLLYRRHRNRNVPFWFGVIFFLMYFYTVGMWGVPLYIFLLFTTQTDT